MKYLFLTLHDQISIQIISDCSIISISQYYIAVTSGNSPFVTLSIFSLFQSSTLSSIKQVREPLSSISLRHAPPRAPRSAEVNRDTLSSTMASDFDSCFTLVSKKFVVNSIVDRILWSSFEIKISRHNALSNYNEGFIFENLSSFERYANIILIRKLGVSIMRFLFWDYFARYFGVWLCSFGIDFQMQDFLALTLKITLKVSIPIV